MFGYNQTLRMPKRQYCNIVEVCAFLAKHRRQFTSYGTDTEVAHTPDGGLVEATALKPSSLFRGQNREYFTLRPTIYRKFPAMSTWQESQTVIIDDDSLVMPHPHYSPDLEREYYFSCIKAAELIAEVGLRFPEFPEDQVDGHALCQHYGLPTHLLDFSEDVWTAGFFASHLFKEGRFTPCGEGTGVMYVLETEKVPPGSLYEIGFQPLPRPAAQRGWLLKVPPEVVLLAVPAVWKIYFQHSLSASRTVGEHFREGVDLVPHDEISIFLEARLSERFVTARGVREYVARVPPYNRDTLLTSIEQLFSGFIPIT